MDQKCKINVFVRIKPDPSESLIQNREKWFSSTETSISITHPSQKTIKTFEFDSIISEDSSQCEVFSRCEVSSKVLKFTKGYNLTILAYGQTGSGKTYTMEGYQYDSKLRPLIPKDYSEIGIVPRSISCVFDSLCKNSKSSYLVFVSYFQIYKERVFDLLEPSKNHLKLKWNTFEGFFVENLSLKPCQTHQEVLCLFQDALKHKTIASHNLNKVSSRSHCVFTITLEKVNKVHGKVYHSKFSLVDLAGSEKQSTTGNEGKALKESIEINKSLFTLRQVIVAISANEKHVPYRDSKLTSILKQSIGGNSLCVMIACISTSLNHFDESLSTLSYASKTHTINNTPVKNLDPKSQLMHNLQTEVLILRQKLNDCQKIINVFDEVQDTLPEAISTKHEKALKKIEILEIENKELKKKLEIINNQKIALQVECNEFARENEILKQENDDLKALNLFKSRRPKTVELKEKPQKLWRFKSKRTILLVASDHYKTLERSESFRRSKKVKSNSSHRPKSNVNYSIIN